MTTMIYAKHAPYNDGHLGKVLEEMELAGAPTIYAMRYKGSLFALSGSHRLAAAYMLNLVPRVVILEADTGPELDGFYDTLMRRLPVWRFESVLALEAKDIQPIGVAP